MAAPLIPHTAAAKTADETITRDQRDHAQRVARAKAVDAEMARINAGAGRVQVAPTVSGGIAQHRTVPAAPPKVEAVKKAEPKNTHPRVKTLKTALSPDATDLLSLVLRADEAYKGARLFDLSAFAIAQALNIREKDALEARAELERAGLIVFRDDGSGNRGFIPRLP
ncbi:hypothetical protein [Rhizobium lusitanum]|uniref:hypothetical protein n=1 Tax=Rhizobium lusitanum TaxID=293958 RepID=UPI00195AC3B3|nr:hypothetical protein [Rhizobium lusitanum]MBM7048359.1 hypothetical protein [Rhizobium lusitanum]